MDNNYVEFGDVARRQIGMQAQYARRYLKDEVLGKDIRWSGDYDNYHFLKIHKDDVATFVDRVKAHREEMGR